MLIGDRSRKAPTIDVENHVIAHPTAKDTQKTLAQQYVHSSYHQAALPPGEAQAPLVPLSVDTDMLPGVVARKPTTTTLRQPVVIPSSGRKSSGVRPPQGRRPVVHVAVTLLLAIVVMGALAAVIPTSNGKAFGLNLFSPISQMVSVKQSDAALIASQAATATAVTQGGYDPGGNMVYAGVQAAPTYTNVTPSDAGNLNRFFYGQCTYYANMRYHQLTGHWVPWLGNANEWAWNAPSYGWIKSDQPNPKGPSIIVLQAYTQGTGYYGHVAIVEGGYASAVNGVPTGNWNWNGHWAAYDTVTFYSGPGVSFLWYPGS